MLALGTLMDEQAGSLQAVKRFGALVQQYCETSPAQLAQDLNFVKLRVSDGEEVVTWAAPREGGAGTAQCEELEARDWTSILRSAGVQCAGPWIEIQFGGGK